MAPDRRLDPDRCNPFQRDRHGDSAAANRVELGSDVNERSHTLSRWTRQHRILEAAEKPSLERSFDGCSPEPRGGPGDQPVLLNPTPLVNDRSYLLTWHSDRERDVC